MKEVAEKKRRFDDDDDEPSWKRDTGIEERRNWEESEGESNGIRGRPGKIAIEGEAGGEKVRKD